MKSAIVRQPSVGGTRGKLIAAAIHLVRRQGYAATTIDEVCDDAAVTKGAFFHHFPTKAALAVAATDHWSQASRELFAAAPYQRLDDPLDRLLGYLDFRMAMLRGEVADFTCLAGTLVQEVYRTHPDIRCACDTCIQDHAAEVEAVISQAMRRHRIRASWSAASLALHTQAVLQGAFVLAKAQGGASALVQASVQHLRYYIESIFRSPANDRVRKSYRKDSTRRRARLVRRHER